MAMVYKDMAANDTHKLEARLEYLEEVNRFTIEALEMAASLGNFQSSINRMHEPSSILKETREKIQRLLAFCCTAFFLVDEDDSDFYLFDCDPESNCHSIKDEVEMLIEDDTFARALQANKPIIVYSRDFKKQLLLHVMATTSRVRGMFVGVLAHAAKNIPDVSLGLLSIVMLNSANTLESFELYRKIGEFNQELQQKIEQLTASEQELMLHRSKLETLVAERTAQLQGTVSHLNQEIAERRKTEEQLRQSQGLLENIFHAIPDFLSLQDRDLRVIMSNAHNGHSTAPQGLEQNRQCYEIYAGRQMPCEPCPVKEAFTTGKMSQLEVCNLPGGTVKEIRAFPIRDDRGEVVMVAEHIRDITEKKKLEDELLKVQKLESVGILAGGVAHDFNNILTAIMGNISLALMDSSSFDNIKKRLGEAEKSCLRARDLTMQLLTFSRGGDPIKKPMRIRELLKDSTIFASHGSGIKCKFEIADDLSPVEADESQISQVMSNLVINACQAMPAGGVLEIKACNVTIEKPDSLPLKRGTYVQILVEDHGTGIPSEHLPKIFDPYFSTKSRGNGLGLAVVFSIIKRHGGLVQADSKLGQGSVFTVYLPAVDADVSPPKAELSPKLAGKGRVLVMDDEEIVREVAREMLTYIGYEAELAEDGVEAIQLYLEAAAKGMPFDAVIMDLTIPGGMGGKQAMEKLLELDPRVKAVVSSGYSNDPTMANHELYGFKGIVAKPYNLDELNEVLQRVLDTP